MKFKLTYRELSLLFGILIAAIIVILYWIQYQFLLNDHSSSLLTPLMEIPSAIKHLASKVHVLLRSL